MFTLTIFLCRSTRFFCPLVVTNFYTVLLVRLTEVIFIGKNLELGQVDEDINALFKIALSIFFKDVPKFFTHMTLVWPIQSPVVKSNPLTLSSPSVRKALRWPWNFPVRTGHAKEPAYDEVTISLSNNATFNQLCLHSAGQCLASNSIKSKLCVRTRKIALECSSIAGKIVARWVWPRHPCIRISQGSRDFDR